MVTKALQNISRAEKQLEHLAGSSGTQDPAEQSAREMRQLAETVTFSALKTTEQWGKKSIEKLKEKTEDIIL